MIMRQDLRVPQYRDVDIQDDAFELGHGETFLEHMASDSDLFIVSGESEVRSSGFYD